MFWFTLPFVKLMTRYDNVVVNRHFLDPSDCIVKFNSFHILLFISEVKTGISIGAMLGGCEKILIISTWRNTSGYVISETIMK